MNLCLKLQKWRLLPLIACVALSTNCRNSEPEPQQIDSAQLKESLIKINKTLAHDEALAIDSYIARRGLMMERSGTGLRYMIIKPGKGALAEAGMRATVNFRIELLDGTYCYSSDSLGPQSFVVDQDQIESGIHEGIKLLSKGAKAKFILPSHLAHGLLGDQDKIPAKSSVVYDIEVIDLTQTP